MAFAASANLGHGYPTPGPQSPSGQNVMDHVFFLSNTAWNAARESGDFDYIIIGTGFCSLAFLDRALKINPFARILVIERGPFFLPEHFQNLPIPFVSTLGGLSETFPWTLSGVTAGTHGFIRWQHGIGPFFGGRSTLWSAWCPRPTEEEMTGWPVETIRAAQAHFESAEKLLQVQPADKVDKAKDPALVNVLSSQRPVYGRLQHIVQDRLKNICPSTGVYRAEAAPLASSGVDENGIDFQKFATPGPILEHVSDQKELEKNGKGSPLHIVTNCTVERIIQQDGVATALQTTRGVCPIGKAKLILAMGTLPPTTLVQNSFKEATSIGERFSAHTITSIVARIPKCDLDPNNEFRDLEVGAFYIGGKGKDYTQQFHIQMSALCDRNPAKNAGIALRYMPDVVATASRAQLVTSKDYVVFVCAVLGELDYRNKDNFFRNNPSDSNPTTNSFLQVKENENDLETWNAMDRATFEVLENTVAPNGKGSVQYWHGTPDEGTWMEERPSIEGRRVDALVHESSTLHIGEDDDAPVGLDYRLKVSENVYVTGGGLWPQGGSWNPTMAMVALSQDLAEKLAKKKDKIVNCQ